MSFFAAGKAVYSASQVSDFMKPHLRTISNFAKNNIKKDDLGGLGGLARKTIHGINRHEDTAATVYGGAIGGVSGMMSSDRDTGFWQGAMMGAAAGRSAVTQGVSKNALIGAGVGAASSFVTGESLIGSAFTGAVLGAGGMKYGRGMIDKYKSTHSKRTAAYAQKDLGDPGRRRSFGIAARATASAIKKDVGQTWRGRSTRRSKNSSRMNSNQSR